MTVSIDNTISGKATINVDGVPVADFNSADQSLDIRGNFNPSQLSINGRQVSAFANKNVVINSDCTVVQDVASKSISGNGDTYGGSDMFRFILSGAGGTATQSQGSLIFNGETKKTIRQTVDSPNTDITGTNYWHGILHVFEGLNVQPLNGKKIAISFIFNSNVSGVFSVALNNANVSPIRSYVTSFSYTAGSPKRIQLVTSTESPNGTFPALNLNSGNIAIGFLNSGDFLTLNTEEWVEGTNDYVVSGFTNWGAQAGNFIELTELQVEPDQVTEYQPESFADNLRKCQRYYEKSYNYGVSPGTTTIQGRILVSGTTNSSGIFHTTIYYKVPKRVSASITYYSQNGTLGQWDVDFPNQSIAATIAPNSSDQGHNVTQVSSGIASSVAQTFGHYVADARL